MDLQDKPIYEVEDSYERSIKCEDNDINRRPLTQFVIWQLRQNNDALDKKILTRIGKLDRVLTGSSLWERTNRYVLHTNCDEDYMFRGEEYKELRLPGKRVRHLAKEYMTDFTAFSGHLPQLVREAGHRLPELGMECGKLATTRFDEAIFSHIESDSTDISGIFIGGYLAGLRTHDAER